MVMVWTIGDLRSAVTDGNHAGNDRCRSLVSIWDVYACASRCEEQRENQSFHCGGETSVEQVI